MPWRDDLTALAEERGFSGAIAVSRDGTRAYELARGFADRANKRPNTMDTVFATASVAKSLTALTVASVIESGELSMDTTLRSVLPDRLDTVDPTVTIEQVLAHRSGMGDYFDEDEDDDVDDYVMDIPVHRLASPMDYMPAIEGPHQRATAGSTFAYNNGAFVMLSIALEVATGRSYYDLVRERVTAPAGMADTEFHRSDRLPPGTALGYLQDGRSNVLHLHVRGAGDGGVYTTVADLERLWAAMFDGRVVPLPVIDDLLTARSDVPQEGRRYGLGFWLAADRAAAQVEGMDAGVSARSVHDRTTGVTYVVIANDSKGAWPIAEFLDERISLIADSIEGGSADSRRDSLAVPRS
jgi:CubicO group peptidase (beta-lactamase class C family)